MVLSIVLFLIGIGILWGGAELLVKGSSHLALSLGIRPLIVGLTIVAMGTSSPELAVSLIAAIRDTKAISLGNIIGSNIANIGLVIGVAAAIRPLEIKIDTLKNEVPFLVASVLLFSALSLDGVLDFFDGFALFLLFIGFISYMIFIASRDRKNAKIVSDELDDMAAGSEAITYLKDTGFVIVGVIGLVVGSFFIVQSAVDIAEVVGISQIVIAITMVAVGTSLPELAISAVGAYRGRVDIAVGNAVGSNIFNTLFVIAIVSMIHTIPVDFSLFTFEYPFQLGFTLIVIPMMFTRYRMSQREGFLLLLFYLIFTAMLFMR